MTTATTFSTDGSQVISRSLDVAGTATSPQLLAEVYELERCASWINSHNFKRVALQLPDSLLVDSAAIAEVIETDTEAVVFILADTSYGSCCVDEVAAQHYQADCLIHFGPSCLSPTARLPVLLVFGQQPLDVTDCCKQFRELYPDRTTNIEILYDVVYAYCIGKIYSCLKGEYENIEVGQLSYLEDNGQSHPVNSKGTNNGTEETKTERNVRISHCGRIFNMKIQCSIEDYQMFYIGGESLTLTNIMMTFNKCKFSSYNPMNRTCRHESVNINRLLMKRYYLVERAKDAQIVGIVAGTLGVTNYLSIIKRLKELLHNAGKKCYTFVMGKLNTAKLANFLEIDIYVLVACPENSLLDSSEFYRPVVTPFEMELACNQARQWSGDYVVDFQQLLPGGSSFVEMANYTESETDVSLVSGSLRRIGQEKEDPPADGTSGALTIRDKDLSVANIEENSAGAFLQERSWRGLDPKLGKTPVVKAEEGRAGIAAGYSHEQAS